MHAKIIHVFVAAVFAAAATTAIAAASANDIPGFAPGNDAESNGLAIAEEAARRDDGFGDSRSTMLMILSDARGNEARREMSSKTLEMDDDGERTILYFENPPDVEGTAFLTHSHAERDDDQWLYLPALKRVKRIASNNRSGAFMSSEFSYEDLASDEVAKYTYRYLGEDMLDDVATYRIERTPVGRSGYSKQIVWLDQQHLRLRKADYYDRGGQLLKTLTASDYQQYASRFWRPRRMLMVNHQNGRQTVLEWRDYRFGNGFAVSEFERSALDTLR